jgi:AraC family transcriptional regulator
MHRLNGIFYGDTLKQRELAGLTLCENRYTPNLRIQSHAHERPYFSMVLAGSYQERYGRKTQACTHLSACFHAPGEMHSNHFDNAGGRVFSIEFGSPLLERISELGLRVPDSNQRQSGMAVQLGYRLYREFLANDMPSRLALEGVALELVADICRFKTRNSMSSPPWIERTEELFLATFRSPMGLYELSAAVGVHPVHLARDFRKHRGCTVGDYVRRLRIDYACSALLQTEAALAEIAADSGFADQSHFTRIFHRAMGMPPGHFRKLCRRKSGSTALRTFNISQKVRETMRGV